MTSSLAEGSHVFLEHVHPVWKDDSSASGSPQSPTGGMHSPQSATGKQSGRVELPFEFDFPTEFSVGGSGNGKDPDSNSTGSGKQYATPQTLMERGVSATIVYEVVLKVVSGAFFRSAHKYVCFILHA